MEDREICWVTVEHISNENLPTQIGRNIYILQWRQRLSRPLDPLPLRPRNAPRAAPHPSGKRLYHFAPSFQGGRRLRRRVSSRLLPGARAVRNADEGGVRKVLGGRAASEGDFSGNKKDGSAWDAINAF